MFEETKEEKKREKKKWFQSLSLISSEEESDYSTSDSSLLDEVQNANLRFPYPIFSDDSDEEIKLCVLNNKKIYHESKINQLLKQTKPSCKKVTGHVSSLRSGKSNTSFLKSKNSSSKKSKYKPTRDDVKRVWNYTKKRKKQHVYHRPSTVFSTSEDDSGPEKKKKKKIHGRKPSQLKPTSSEENLNESTALPKSEFSDNSYHVSRSFRSFLDSSSNNENSDCKESNSTKHNKQSLSYSFHDLSSSNSTDTEHSRHSTLSNIKDSECKNNSGRKRLIQSISSSEEENEEVIANKCKTKTRMNSSPKRITIPSKHPFKNLIASLQLREDNFNMKRGLKFTPQRKENNYTPRPIEAQNKPSKKLDYPQRKMKAHTSPRNVSLRSKICNSSKIRRLKKHFISSNKYSVELSKQIQSNMNMNKTSETSAKQSLKHKTKKPRPSYKDDKSDEGRLNSNSKDTARVFSHDKEELKKKEAKYTVNVNVYCNSNQSDPSRSIPDTSEDCNFKNTTGQKSSHDLDINLSVVQEEKDIKLTSKKVRISHINQSKSKLECRTTSEDKVKKNISMKSVNKHTTEPCHVNKTGQFDLVGNIISQMKDNPYAYQKCSKKSSEQCPDSLGWFSNSNTYSSSNNAVSSHGFNKEPAQYASTSVFKGPILQTAQSTANNQSLSISDTSLYPLHSTPHNSVGHQENTIFIGSPNTSCSSSENSSLVPTKTSTVVSTAGLVYKHSANEVIIPFYSANHDEYKERLENQQYNISKTISDLNRQNGKPSSGSSEGSNISYLQGNSSKSNASTHNSESPETGSKISNEEISLNISGSGLPIAILNDANKIPKSNSAKSCQITLGRPISKNEQKKNTGQNKVQKNNKNANHLSMNTVPKMDRGSNNKSTKRVITPEKTCSQNIPNELDCNQGSMKKGVKIRLQGNEYVWYQRSNSNEGADDSSLKLLNSTLTNDKLASLFTMKEQNYSEEKNNANKSEILTSESRTNLANDEFRNLSSNSENSTSDSNEDPSLSDDSSSSSASSDSNDKSGESISSDSSTSENTTIQSIQEERGNISLNASTLISDTDLEVITLNSSSDDEPLTSESAVIIDSVHLEPSDCGADNRKVDHVEHELGSVKTGLDISIFDPIEDNSEFEPSNASVSAVYPICTNSTTIQNGESSSKSSLIGKIRIKTAEELNSEILQSQNGSKICSKQTEVNLLRPTKSTKTTHGSVAKATEMGVDLLTRRAPLKIKLSKVSSEHKSLYKVQSIIPIANDTCQSSNKINTDNKKYNFTDTLFVKTGVQNYEIVQLGKHLSKTKKPLMSVISNSSNIPKNSQNKKLVPKLVTIASKPSVVVIPASSVSQLQNYTQLTKILQSSSATCTNSYPKLSEIPTDSQHLSVSSGVAVTQETHKKSDKTPSLIHTPSQQPVTHFINPQSQLSLEATFIKLCDELFTEVVCLKIPKMVDDLHLTIVYDGFKEERLKRTEQLLSPETMLSEKIRAEREFNEQIRIRAHSFVPLFNTVINKINKSNLKTLVIALYIRLFNQLQRIDPKYIKYRLSLRHIIKSMLLKSGSTYTEVCHIFSDNDTCFAQNYLFIENLLKQYDLYVEQRQKQINDQLVSSETEEHQEINKHRSEENNLQLKKISTPDNCSALKTFNPKPQRTRLILPKNLTSHSNLAQIEPSTSKNSEPNQHIPVTNLDHLMFNSLFKQS